MIRSRRNILVIAVLIVAVAVICVCIFSDRQNTTEEPLYVNSVLGIRGFLHGALKTAIGESGIYEVYVGEEFKVTWKTGNLSEDGQLLYRGPAGVGAGLISIPYQNIASQSQSPFLAFTPTEAGIAKFILTVTGPGVDGVYTVPSAITVNILP